MPLTTCRRGAPFLPPNNLSLCYLRSKSCSYHLQTTTKPILPSLFLAAVTVPEAPLPTPTPFNLHNCFPTGGFLQTAVSDAPRTTSRTYLLTYLGRIRYSTSVSGQLPETCAQWLGRHLRIHPKA